MCVYFLPSNFNSYLSRSLREGIHSSHLKTEGVGFYSSLISVKGTGHRLFWSFVCKQQPITPPPCSSYSANKILLQWPHRGFRLTTWPKGLLFVNKRKTYNLFLQFAAKKTWIKPDYSVQCLRCQLHCAELSCLGLRIVSGM